MKYKVINEFSWAHHGVLIKHYKVGDELDTDDESIDHDIFEVAKTQLWIENSSILKSETISNKAHSSPAVKETLIEKAKKIFK